MTYNDTNNHDNNDKCIHHTCIYIYIYIYINDNSNNGNVIYHCRRLATPVRSEVHRCLLVAVTYIHS